MGPSPGSAHQQHHDLKRGLQMSQFSLTSCRPEKDGAPNTWQQECSLALEEMNDGYSMQSGAVAQYTVLRTPEHPS